MNKRNTIQRSLVLEAVREMQCHATTDEIYDAIKKKHPNISRGTVYRNLNLLSDVGDIHKIEMPSGADRFDHINREHYHARCLKCGKVFDVEMEFMADLEKSIRDTHGFEITGHDVIFKGTCSECKTLQLE
jgi:Fur family ferric uptake transcriptional regulator/Fur family peroxide stress response transcriptional regulator